MTNVLWRATVIVHRYLGVAIGILMLIWFVSGIVMMYVPFPRISEAERLRVAPPISWQACCRFGEDALGDEQRVIRAQVENHLGVPALRLRRPGQIDAVVDLARGSRMPIDAEAARKVVLDAAPRILRRDAAIIAQ